MNLKKHIYTQRSGTKDPKALSLGRPVLRSLAEGGGLGEGERIFGATERAVALVITLLMLSVITFLAIAFLAMTKRDRSAVTATLDIDTARAMSDAALARAQAGIIAQMMAQKDVLSYDYSTSHNFISPVAFISGNANFNNVNYDSFLTNSGYTAQDWAQNIGNLFYDPRPPVFVMNNGNLGQPTYDFRFWVDINRNGRFETNGLVQDILPSGAANTGVFDLVNGEPEWIGVLKYPETNHSQSNPFIGRYAFMALPIGKTLDFNYIHNYSKYAAGGVGNPPMNMDAFIRDEGVGSWELNLGALINDISPMYQTNPPYVASYLYAPSYNAANGPGGFGVFYDASQFLAFRYGFNASYPQWLRVALGNPPVIAISNIDEYGAFPSTIYPFDYTGVPQLNAPWPGAYNSNMFYDIQDLFDTTKTGPNFANNLRAAGAQIDTTNRYTFQRLLSCIGMSSAPEYGVYVYANGLTGAPETPQTSFRTKVNINYNNTSQIQAGPYAPMPTNLTGWDPLTFFTNAADLLLCSQEFPVTNLAGGLLYYNHFGLNGIPIYNSTNTSFCYNAKIHRMLQLAANIYESTSAATNYNVVNVGGFSQTVYFPHIYRPLFGYVSTPTNVVISIIGYANVARNDQAVNYPFYDLSDTRDILNGIPANKFNIWGIPWVVGTVKGLPSFNKYSYQNQVVVERKLLFVRGTANGQPDTNHPPKYLNQFYNMTVSNLFGMDAWNPYTNAFPLPVRVHISNYVTVQITNNYNFASNFYLLNVTTTPTTPDPVIPAWPGWPGSITSTNGLQPFFQTNVISLPLGYYSDTTHLYNAFTNPVYNGGAVPVDLQQMPFTPRITAGNGHLPVHTWMLYVTNHVVYYIYDDSSGRLLDFVNLGPFGNSLMIMSGTTDPGGALVTDYFNPIGATDQGGLSKGVLAQITFSYSNPQDPDVQFYNSLQGLSPNYPGYVFGTPEIPHIILQQTETWEANDPLVHYTLDDLAWPGNPGATPTFQMYPTNALTNAVGTISKRYDPWPGSNYTGEVLFRDPGVSSANNWQFPTNNFPGVGWLGRVHRGTPWQTIYLKPDNPGADPFPITRWASAPNVWSLQEIPGYLGSNSWAQGDANANPAWVNTLDTYPTTDWALIDLFTAVPNDNAARGLLSVNQTNDAAWAALFAGVIVITNSTEGIPLNPTNDVYYLMDTPTSGINAVRALQPNGIFHKIGDILQAGTLTVSPPEPLTAPLTDEMVERIPQQTLSLLKLGLPQFVVYSWGQSLRPKNLYSSGSGSLLNICTNYEITGEFLTRTVCHVVSDPAAAAPKIVVDNYNIMPGN